MYRLVSLLGIAVFILIAWILSENRKKFDFKIVINALLIQFIFALLILKTYPGKLVFEFLNKAFSKMIDFTHAGSDFVFGGLLKEWSFALTILPTIIFFSSFFAVLYYFGILQFFVKAFAWLLSKVLKTSGAESLSAAANIFIGQTEAPLMVRPYIEKMTRSELMCIMTGGLATVAGGVLAAYVNMGISAGHLIAASVMSAPAAILFAKIMVPETETPQTSDTKNIAIPVSDKNAIDAAARGASEGIYLAINVTAMLVAFIAFVTMFNYFFGFFGTSMEGVLGVIFKPFAYLMGVPWEEAGQVGSLLGQKTVLNEFIAYDSLSKMNKDTVTALSDRSTIIATYALCGFSNFGSIAILLGGLGTMAPTRRSEIASLGIKALIAGSFACFITANIAGMLI
ncbi:MAG TPA: nucleoside transporter C-terminal domain-containing protein [bacterium]|nr:nucleoside transporter C-terminal domain-containing protein [bacterium]HPS29376.1 nucleoside transporter C-terminal domain-containing protein [bacterium]